MQLEFFLALLSGVTNMVHIILLITETSDLENFSLNADKSKSKGKQHLLV